MNSKAFIWDHFFAKHCPFSLEIKTNGSLTGIHCLNNTAGYFSYLLAKVIKLSLFFSIADALLDRLAGCLSSDTTEIFRG